MVEHKCSHSNVRQQKYHKVLLSCGIKNSEGSLSYHGEQNPFYQTRSRLGLEWYCGGGGRGAGRSSF